MCHGGTQAIWRYHTGLYKISAKHFDEYLKFGKTHRLKHSFFISYNITNFLTLSTGWSSIYLFIYFFFHVTEKTIYRFQTTFVVDNGESLGRTGFMCRLGCHCQSVGLQVFPAVRGVWKTIWPQDPTAWLYFSIFFLRWSIMYGNCISFPYHPYGTFPFFVFYYYK